MHLGNYIYTLESQLQNQLLTCVLLNLKNTFYTEH